MQLLGVSEKREALTEAAKVLDVAAPDFTRLETAAKDLAQHKQKWDLLGDFRDDRVSWMTQSVRYQGDVWFLCGEKYAAQCNVLRIGIVQNTIRRGIRGSTDLGTGNASLIFWIPAWLLHDVHDYFAMFTPVSIAESSYSSYSCKAVTPNGAARVYIVHACMHGCSMATVHSPEGLGECRFETSIRIQSKLASMKRIA